jgi:hypothetical protein
MASEASGFTAWGRNRGEWPEVREQEKAAEIAQTYLLKYQFERLSSRGRLFAFECTGNEYVDIERLEALAERYLGLSDQERLTVLPSALGVYERHPENTELGMPGALVHAIERFNDHANELEASIQRIPSHYTVWMLNRILNAPKLEDAECLRWQSLLETVAARIDTLLLVRDDAKQFLQFQRSKAT